MSSSAVLRRATPSPTVPARSDATKQRGRDEAASGGSAPITAVEPLRWPAHAAAALPPSPLSASSASPLLPSAFLTGAPGPAAPAAQSGSWPASSPLSALALYAIALALAAFGNEWSTRIGRELVRTEMESESVAEAVAGARAPAVYDMGRSVLPRLDGLVWLPDLLLLPMFIVAAVMLRHKGPSSSSSSSCSATSSASSARASVATGARSKADPALPSPSSFWSRASLLLVMHAYVLLLRTVSVCVTILGASPRCQQQAALLLHAHNAGFVLNSGCFDLMFSGHSSFAALVGAAALWSGALSRPAKVLVVVLALFAAVANVLVGDHYSADVWVGVYVGASIAAMHRQDIRAAFA